MSIISEFKDFIARGNVMDLAVGVIIGAAFGKITTSLTEDVIMPVLGWLFGGFDFSQHFIRLGALPAGFKGNPASYADLKAAGVAMLGWGQFLTVIINFVILAFIIFLMIRAVNRMMAPKVEAPTGPSEETQLLREIRDSLKK
ncbi:MAG: large conductance mechanosensitive channel protein MscL [Sphingobium sp.]|nr:large conductance mechanosensitive channel protein MscL [Sphingobium sp.]MBP6111843.1 large conductance mechanosensitive channel protein MscL [Sphingobium sp.]MBP8669785.1 large conductance mechanosensitive channel protein MscL [Sphingobium sp.]MBP9156455.1 large conductance mechanosensitive channel protein MscL [Sphingobium sp.]